MPLSIQIVIVLYNSERWIAPCLEAIAESAYDPAEVWVVDNASADRALEIVRRDYRWVKAMRSETNLGFSGANNLGAAQNSESDLIVLLNPDTEVDPQCLGHLVRAFEQNENLGVAGCKLWGPDRKTIQHVGGEIRPNGLSYHVGEGEIDRGQYTGLRPCAYVQGAAMAVRRELWEELGGFDTNFFPAYFEEADFCRRARKVGTEVAVVCEAAVVHHQDPQAQVQSWGFLELLFRGRARYLIKHYRARDWITAYLPSEIKWLLSRDSKRYRRIALRSLWEVWTGSHGAKR